MANPFLGQLTLVGFNFAPRNWAFAAGQILPISTNAALFSLFGTMYGGDGKTNFGLPNLVGNAAMGMGQGPGLQDYIQGDTGGSQTVTLINNTVPPHSHNLLVSAAPGNQPDPGGHSLADARSAGGNLYTPTTTPILQMSPAAVSSFGSGNSHNNMMPYQALNWVVALQGVFPSRP